MKHVFGTSFSFLTTLLSSVCARLPQSSPHPIWRQAVWRLETYMVVSRLPRSWIKPDVVPWAGVSVFLWRLCRAFGCHCCRMWAWLRGCRHRELLKPLSCLSLGNLSSPLQSVCVLGKDDSLGSDFKHSHDWGASESSLLTCFSQGMASSVGNSPQRDVWPDI